MEEFENGNKFTAHSGIVLIRLFISLTQSNIVALHTYIFHSWLKSVFNQHFSLSLQFFAVTRPGGTRKPVLVGGIVTEPIMQL